MESARKFASFNELIFKSHTIELGKCFETAFSIHVIGYHIRASFVLLISASSLSRQGSFYPQDVSVFRKLYVSQFLNTLPVYSYWGKRSDTIRAWKSLLLRIRLLQGIKVPPRRVSTDPLFQKNESSELADSKLALCKSCLVTCILRFTLWQWSTVVQSVVKPHRELQIHFVKYVQRLVVIWISK